MGKFNLAGQRVVNKAKSWNRVGEKMPNPDTDVVTYSYSGDIAMWTKTDSESGLMVRVLVPSTQEGRFSIVFKAPDDLKSTDIVLHRIRVQVAMTSEANHHAIHHARTTKESVYAYVGVSGAKKKGKYFFYSPVFIKNAEGRNELWLDQVAKPIAVDQRGNLVDHTFSQDWGSYIKGFYAYFQETFGLKDNEQNYTQMCDAL